MHFKLANLIFNGSDAMLQYPLLCYRATRGLVIPTSNDAIEIMKSTNVDFTTYFNALSIYKWRKYTLLQRRFIFISRYCGSALTLQQTYAKIIILGFLLQLMALRLVCNDPMNGVRLKSNSPFVREILHAFNISTEGPVNIRNAYYYCDCEELDIHPVELALATTTFKKEDYIVRNVSLLQKEHY